MPNRSRPTMATIAEEAGVSVPTVSKVVNGHAAVAPQTRQRVEELLRKYRYTAPPRRDTSRAQLIDLVLLDLGTQWGMEILAGVEEVAQQAGYGVVVSAVHDRRHDRPQQQWLDNLQARKSAGVLLVLSDLSPAQQEEVDELGIPVVLIDPLGEPKPDVPSVGATNWPGALAATEHLLDLGHQRVAVIGGPQRMLCSRARIEGYRAAMRDADLNIPPDYIRHGDFLMHSGYRETQALLALPEPPTAIFAGSDLMAMGAYEALFEHGLRVPEDVSIVGFDDLPETRWATPPLTTVRQPLTEMAGTAARMVCQLIDGERLETARLELPTPLLVRGSTAAPATTDGRPSAR